MPGQEALETLYEAVAGRFQFEMDRTRNLDDKTSNVIGFVGIIIGIVSGLGVLVSSNVTLNPLNLQGILVISLFSFTFLLLLLSMVFGLLSYRIKKFTVVPDAVLLLGRYEGKRKEDVLRALSYYYALAIDDNMKLNDSKVVNMNRAMNCLLVATMLIPFSVALAIG